MKCAENVLPRASARIKKTGGAQAMECGAVKFDAFTLVVRRIRTSDVRPFIPGKAEPFQVVNKSGDEFRARAGTIKVFVAKYELAPRSAGAFLRGPESAGMAEVEQASRRRGESSAIDLGR